MLKEWIESGDYSQDTRANYEQAARLIIRSGLTLDDFNDSTRCQEKYAAAVFKPTWRRRTIAVHLLRLCSFANYLAHLHITRARHQPLKRLTRRPNQRSIPSDEEIKALLTILRQRYEQAAPGSAHQRWYGKDYLLTAVLIETGARISEAINIERRDLISHAGPTELHHAIMLRGSKSESAERAVQIPAWLSGELQLYARRFQLFGRLFLSRSNKQLNRRVCSEQLTAFCEGLQLSCRVTPHVLRYRFILNLITQGKSALEVMTRAGHTDVQMTVYYFNQVRRLMPWIQVNGDIALLESRKKFWQGRKGEE